MNDNEKEILVHVNPEEIGLLDHLANAEIDPKTGLKNFAPLWELFKQHPQLMAKIAALAKKKPTTYLGEVLQRLQGGMPDTREQALNNPEIPKTVNDVMRLKMLKKLKQDGRYGDTEIVSMPLGLAKFFVYLTGGQPKLNPKDGLLEFFGWMAALPFAAMGASQLFGQLGAMEDNKYYRRQEMDELERLKKFLNFNPVPQMNQHLAEAHKEHRKNLYGFKKGGLAAPPSSHKGGWIKGPGTGQSDSIKTSTPLHSYIIDASSVSDLGDGSSEAGAKELKRFENYLVKKYGKKLPSSLPNKTPQVPVYLANEEYKHPPRVVEILGLLKNKKSKNPIKEGSNVIKNAINELRKDKRDDPSRLPKKAKPFESYLSVKV